MGKMKVEVTLGLRAVRTARGPAKGHLMVNGRAICGEPVKGRGRITLAQFGESPCQKCRRIIERA